MFKNTHKLLLLLMLTLIAFSIHAQQDSLNFPAPQYMLPFYDHFSENHLNAEAMGRGFTVMAYPGRVENAVNNPATLSAAKSYVYMEVTIKPPIDEINQPDSMLFSSPIPFGMFGFSGKLYEKLLGAISYNVPKSLYYDNFSVDLMQGADVVTRYPSYHLHQITGTLAYPIRNFRLGLNLHNQFHSFNDIIVFQTFDRIDKTFYVLRIQPGILYQWNDLNLGLAVTLPVKTEMDVKYLNYDVTLPLKISGGASYQYTNNRFLAEAEWEQFSEMSSAFDDRLTLRLGYEKRIRDVIYRAGLTSVPAVYKGAYRLPVLETTNPEQLRWWQNVPRGGYIGDTSQLYLTAGFTYNFKGGRLTLGLMQDVLGKVPTTQFAMALGFDLETLKGRKFLIFDK